ncbi:MAG: hypothetical protein ISS17_08080 [Bacteroidales bacterium]|nr:hypothetical protein [Bacteroidales bacterium]
MPELLDADARGMQELVKGKLREMGYSKLGVGGEWATGQTYVGETFPETKGKKLEE